MTDTNDIQSPATLRKPFYGWIIVAVAFLIGFTEAGVFQNILSIFLKPMAEEFGWSRSLITGSIAFGSICGGIIAPFIGPFLDRHGPRMMAFWGVLLLSAGLMALSLLSKVWQLYLFFGIGRMIAVGVLGLVISVTISNWFIRQRGRAMGIAHLGSRAGSAIFPPLAQFTILAFGWRAAWGALGLVVFLLSAIPSLIFLKRRPEDVGLRPDGQPTEATSRIGDSSEKANDGDSQQAIEPIWTREQALHDPSFWLLVLLVCFIGFSGAGVNFHMFPFLTDRGIAPGMAVFVLSIIAVASATGGLILGYLAERFETKNLLAIVVVILGLLFLSLFLAVRNVPLLFVFGIFFGALRGGMMPLLPIIWADFYGRISMGTVFGLSRPFALTANAFGPLFGAFCFDALGTYTVPFFIFSILFFLAGLIGFFMKAPKDLKAGTP